MDKEEYAKYLERAYKQEKFPKPRNAIGLAKDLPPEEMEKLMLTHAQAGRRGSAQRWPPQRSQTVKDHLVSKGQSARGTGIHRGAEAHRRRREGQGQGEAEPGGFLAEMNAPDGATDLQAVLAGATALIERGAEPRLSQLRSRSSATLEASP
ncbi:MAG: hypothetical protein MZW92_16290 [Comamonadaceae bacterium]|nr:hypothetical protein [Comamonadaceae bacterium]